MKPVCKTIFIADYCFTVFVSIITTKCCKNHIALDIGIITF